VTLTDLALSDEASRGLSLTAKLPVTLSCATANQSINQSEKDYSDQSNECYCETTITHSLTHSLLRLTS